MKVVCMLVAGALAVAGEKRLLEFGPGDRRWVTEEEVVRLASLPGKKKAFMDVTDHNVTRVARNILRDNTYPEPGVHEAYATSIGSLITGSDIVDTLNHLSSYHTRYYTTQEGEEAVRWLEQQYKAAIGNRNDITVEIFDHTFGRQPSLIVTIEGNDPEIRAETVIIGGHIDSISGGGGTARAPGVDDDGTGSATNLAVFRRLVTNGFRPARTVEFHAYAAEEVGLRGSQAIADAYAATGRSVYAMVQLDMTGYNARQSVPSISLIQDNTNADLNTFLEKAVAIYCTIPATKSSCGYGCSDHASFTQKGYPAAFPFESDFANLNPDIHTPRDTLDKLSVPHMLEFAKLAVGYIADLACAPGIESCT